MWWLVGWLVGGRSVVWFLMWWLVGTLGWVRQVWLGMAVWSGLESRASASWLGCPERSQFDGLVATELSLSRKRPSQASKGIKKTHQARLRKQSNLAQQSSVTKPPNLFVLVLTQICCGGREAKLGSGLELELELELELARTGIC